MVTKRSIKSGSKNFERVLVAIFLLGSSVHATCVKNDEKTTDTVWWDKFCGEALDWMDCNSDKSDKGPNTLFSIPNIFTKKLYKRSQGCKWEQGIEPDTHQGPHDFKYVVDTELKHRDASFQRQSSYTYGDELWFKEEEAKGNDGNASARGKTMVKRDLKIEYDETLTPIIHDWKILLNLSNFSEHKIEKFRGRLRNNGRWYDYVGETVDGLPTGLGRIKVYRDSWEDDNLKEKNTGIWEEYTGIWGVNEGTLNLKPGRVVFKKKNNNTTVICKGQKTKHGMAFKKGYDSTHDYIYFLSQGSKPVGECENFKSFENNGIRSIRFSLSDDLSWKINHGSATERIRDASEISKVKAVFERLKSEGVIQGEKKEIWYNSPNFGSWCTLKNSAAKDGKKSCVGFRKSVVQGKHSIVGIHDARGGFDPRSSVKTVLDSNNKSNFSLLAGKTILFRAGDVLYRKKDCEKLDFASRLCYGAKWTDLEKFQPPVEASGKSATNTAPKKPGEWTTLIPADHTHELRSRFPQISSSSKYKAGGTIDEELRVIVIRISNDGKLEPSETVVKGVLRWNSQKRGDSYWSFGFEDKGRKWEFRGTPEDRAARNGGLYLMDGRNAIFACDIIESNNKNSCSPSDAIQTKLLSKMV